MIRVHHRTAQVDLAEADLTAAMFEIAERHELTYLEALKCLNLTESVMLKYALRAERHPDDPERKGDEE